jgi:hypothetical protein
VLPQIQSRGIDPDLGKLAVEKGESAHQANVTEVPKSGIVIISSTEIAVFTVRD